MSDIEPSILPKIVGQEGDPVSALAFAIEQFFKEH
jgi:hypothetical protein